MKIVIPVLALVFGLALGLFLPVVLPSGLISYMAVWILILLVTLSEVFRRDKINYRIFISGFLLSAAFISLLIFAGEKLDLDIYTACVILITAVLFKSACGIFKRVAGEKTIDK